MELLFKTLETQEYVFPPPKSDPDGGGTPPGVNPAAPPIVSSSTEKVIDATIPLVPMITNPPTPLQINGSAPAVISKRETRKSDSDKDKEKEKRSRSRYGNFFFSFLREDKIDAYDSMLIAYMKRGELKRKYENFSTLSFNNVRISILLSYCVKYRSGRMRSRTRSRSRSWERDRRRSRSREHIRRDRERDRSRPWRNESPPISTRRHDRRYDLYLKCLIRILLEF